MRNIAFHSVFPDIIPEGFRKATLFTIFPRMIPDNMESTQLVEKLWLSDYLPKQECNDTRIVCACSRDSIYFVGRKQNVLVYIYIDFGLHLAGWIQSPYSRSGVC